MRPRAITLLLTLAAAAGALLRRSRRRAAVAAGAGRGSITVPDTASRAIAGPPRALAAGTPEPSEPIFEGDVVIADEEGDHDMPPDPQVEGETGCQTIHNAAPRPSDSPFRSVAWHLLDGEPAATATELRIGFSLIARIETLARIDVRETPSQVFITVLARFDPPEGGWFAYAEAQQATVALDEALGERRLVAAPEDPPPEPLPGGTDGLSPPPPGDAADSAP